MSDDEYEVPLQDQRAFGAGLKRKRVHFVPSSTSIDSFAQPAKSTNPTSVADRYLSLVLPKSDNAVPRTTKSSKKPPSIETESLYGPSSIPKCEICALPIPTSSTTKPHESTLAHQVCLEHSHPPSHLDRSRFGLRLLQSRGWDPDSRTGLGAHGQGIQFPIKAKAKDDKLGLGLVFPGEKNIKKKEVINKLDAGKVRKLEEKNRRKRERLQEIFYRSEELERYLGAG